MLSVFHRPGADGSFPKKVSASNLGRYQIVRRSFRVLKLARALDRRVASLGLTVDDAVERLKGVRLVCLGDVKLGLWRLAESYPAAQTEVLGVLPKLAAPVLSLAKANRRRLSNPRQGRSSQ